MFTIRVLCLSLCLLPLLMPSPVQASQQLSKKMHQIAVSVLKNTKNEPVSIGEFSPTGLKLSNSGPGIEQLLKEQLRLVAKKKNIISNQAKYEVKGDYAFVRSRENKAIHVIKIVVRIMEVEFGEELTEMRVTASMDGTSTIAEITQSTARIDPDGSKSRRNQELLDQLKNPSVHIHGKKKTSVSSHQKSPYAVEIKVKPLKNYQHHQSKPRSIEIKHGMAFVNIQQKELYEVKLYNRSNRPVAAKLLIDGLDMFRFCIEKTKNGSPAYTHMIIEPHKETTIVGWFIKLKGKNNYSSFLVTAYGKGAISKTGIKSRGKVGVIHVQFAHCFPLANGQTARSGNETGFGPPQTINQSPVHYEIKPPHDFVSIRYTKPQK